MGERTLADLVLVVHAAFIVFVVVGALAVWRWPALVWLHVPAVFWGVLLELRGWTCPLTPLENALRKAGGEAGYAGGFVDHYLSPIVYPPGLTPGIQVALGVGVLALNAGAYFLLWRRRSPRGTRRRARRSGAGS